MIKFYCSYCTENFEVKEFNWKDSMHFQYWSNDSKFYKYGTSKVRG